MADCPECGAGHGNHKKGCSQLTAAQKKSQEGTAERSRGVWRRPGVVAAASKALVAKHKEPEYKGKISKARKEQHAKKRGGKK